MRFRHKKHALGDGANIRSTCAAGRAARLLVCRTCAVLWHGWKHAESRPLQIGASLRHAKHAYRTSKVLVARPRRRYAAFGSAGCMRYAAIRRHFGSLACHVATCRRRRRNAREAQALRWHRPSARFRGTFSRRRTKRVFRAQDSGSATSARTLNAPRPSCASCRGGMAL